MKLQYILAVLLTLSAVFSYLNHRYIRLPVTIGVMVIALVLSLALVALDGFGLDLKTDAARLLQSIDFNETLLHGMLSLLLFAGALNLNLADLMRHKLVILVLATVGVVGSAFLMGFLSHWIFRILGMDIPLIYCLLFGTLISPTDPIAVLGILKTAGVPKRMETIFCGESLFNDGVAVVVFIVLLDIAGGAEPVTAGDVLALFMKEAAGGVVYGLLIGGVAYWMLKQVDNYQVEVLITLALVVGGFALADVLHISGPLAIVMAGLLIGNHGRLLAMSSVTRHHLDMFWELIDEILNAVLFVLMGLEVLVLSFERNYLLASVFLVPALLLSRLVSVGAPIALFPPFRTIGARGVTLLTWGGLRGGISVALALSLPPAPHREVLLATTYVIVVFSVIVQGLTVGRLVKKPAG